MSIEQLVDWKGQCNYDFDWMENCICGGSVCDECQKRLDFYKDLFYMAKHPVEQPNPDTKREFDALFHLRQAQCPYTPWLIGINKWKVPPGLEEEDRGMTGGYCWFIVMTKVPGKQLTVRDLLRMSKCERGEVRQAFKTALM